MNKLKKLVNKALKDSPKAVPSKGCKYLKDVPVGSIFVTRTGMKGVLIDCEINAKVIILSVPNIEEEDKNYYLGKQLISTYTEVLKK